MFSPVSSRIQNFSYRPEIDGLRALAVLAVIMFHAKIASERRLFRCGCLFCYFWLFDYLANY